MGREQTKQATNMAAPKSSKDLLKTFDTGLQKIRHSLDCVRKSVRDMQALMDDGEYDQRNLSDTYTDTFKSLASNTVENTSNRALSVKYKLQLCENQKVSQGESRDFKKLSGPGRICVVKNSASFYFDVNDSANDGLQSDGELNTRPSDAEDLNQSSEANADDPDNKELDEETKNKPETTDEDVNQELLTVPSIVLISATPVDLEVTGETEIVNDAESETAHDVESVVSEKVLSKQVSFKDEEMETVFVVPNQDESRRSSLDDGVLEISEKRLEELDKTTALRRSQSVDLNKRSLSYEGKVEVFVALKKSVDNNIALIEDESSKLTEEAHQEIKDLTTEVKPEEIKDVQIITDLLPTADRVMESEVSHLEAGEENIAKADELVQSKLDVLAVSVKDKYSDRSMLSVSSADTTPVQRSVSQILKIIGEVVYKDGVPVMLKKPDFEGQSEIFMPAVPPNSLLSEQEAKESQKAREEKVKPKEKQKEPCDSILRRKLGRTAYEKLMDIQAEKVENSKIRGIDWSRKLQAERFSSRPHILYKSQWKQNKLLKEQLGPGSYETKDFLQLANEKPRSQRGICENLGPRFDKTFQSLTPGPGTYGIGGVPQKAIEDNAHKSFSTKGILDAGDRKRNLPSVGSHLPPGTYNFKSFTEVLLNKRAGLKGPYNYFSAERDEPIVYGYFAAPKPPPMGPGHYKIKSFVDEMCSPTCHNKGRFSKLEQYPEVPTERICLFTSGRPIKDIPGPDAYTIKELPTYQTVNSPGFLSSSKRDDRIMQTLFTRSSSLVGPGRYKVEKFDETRHVNGHSSVFKSKTEKPNEKMTKLLQERLRPKHPTDEVNWCHTERANYSVIGMM